MLSGKFKDAKAELAALPWGETGFFLLATPKYDGIRALMIDGNLVSRTFKDIQNKHIHDTCVADLPDNLDGELVAGTFNETSGNVMRHGGEPDFEYHVFDYVADDLARPYHKRMKDLKALKLPSYCVKVLPVRIATLDDLLEYEAKCLGEGFEGAMIREPQSRYKCGRGTAKALDLVKIKRFKDAEARVVGFDEEMHNANTAEKDNFGRTKRSSSKENKHGLNTLGALRVSAINGPFKGVAFKIGTGFDHALRQKIWDDRENLNGSIVRFKFQAEGGDTRPRFPVFQGFRDKSDL